MKKKIENELIEDMKMINLEEKMIEEIEEMKLKIMKKYINNIIIDHNEIIENDSEIDEDFNIILSEDNFNKIIKSENLDYDFMIKELNNLYINEIIYD